MYENKTIVLKPFAGEVIEYDIKPDYQVTDDELYVGILHAEELIGTLQSVSSPTTRIGL